MAEQLTIIKANGKREALEPEKLRASLLKSGADNELTQSVLERVLPELHNDMTTSEVYQRVFSKLKDINKPVARSYSLRRAVMDLGPTGFPFEDFIAEIFKAKGFQCLTRETLLGGCVPHEVDVVAYNPKKLFVVEAKFHNKLGVKSDLKVALYVKARFDDLKNNVYNYGGNDKKITDCWLVTNTKFSSTAIHYGECSDLVMIGWNYPEKGNLQDMIEEEVLHPITCLSSLSNSNKKDLVSSGVVLCSTIRNSPELLNKILGDKLNIEPIINEINGLFV